VPQRLALILLLLATPLQAADQRIAVQLPAAVAEQLRANMRDHLATLDKLLGQLAAGQLQAAGQMAEERLGLSAMQHHHADHIAPYLPEPMRLIGSRMHEAASHFGRIAVEGDRDRALTALREITATCTACHNRYQLR